MNLNLIRWVDIIPKDNKKLKLPYLVDEVIHKMIDHNLIPSNFEFDNIDQIIAKTYTQRVKINCNKCENPIVVEQRERDSLNAMFNFILGYSIHKYGLMKK